MTAYVLLSLEKIVARSMLYQSLNIVGAVGFIVNGIANNALPSAALNVVWMLMGVYALWRMQTRA